MKKLSIMIFMAASMLAACDNSNQSNRTTPEDPDYVSTNGVSVDNDQDEVEMERTSNSEMAAEEGAATGEAAEGATEEKLSEGASEAEARAREAMEDEMERVSYWTVDEENIKPTEESIRGNLDQMDKNFGKMVIDIKHIETGTYNPQGRLSRAAQQQLKEAESTINSAKQKVEQARNQYEAGKHEAAATKLKDANKKLADAREKYMKAIEKETGVELKNAEEASMAEKQ